VKQIRTVAMLATLAWAAAAAAQTQPAAQKAFAEGQALVSEKKSAEAADKFDEVVAADPGFAPGWYALAAARRRAGQCDRAIVAYRRYAKLQPAEIEPYYGLGLCLRDAGDSKGAADALSRYVSQEKRPESQRWVEHARKVLAELEPPAHPDAAAKTPAPEAPAAKSDGAPSPAAGVYSEAQSLRDRGHIEEAISKFRQAITTDPTYMPARAALGELLIKIRRDDEAITVFRNAVDRSPGYPLAWYELAFALRVRGRLPEAVEAYKRYIKLRPSDPDPYFGLARTLQKLGKTQDAVKAYETYLSLEKRPSEEKWVKLANAQLAALR